MNVHPPYTCLYVLCSYYLRLLVPEPDAIEAELLDVLLRVTAASTGGLAWRIGLHLTVCVNI